MATRLPVLPELPADAPEWARTLNQNLRTYFQIAANPATIGAAKILLPFDRFPTDANLANLRQGEVYRDTTAADVLKVKT